MLRSQRTSIKNKLLMVYITTTAIVLASAFIISVSFEVASSKKSIISGLNVVGEIIADRGAASLAFSDIESANSNLRTLRSHDSIVYACIRSVENEAFAEYSADIEEVFKCDEYSEKNSVNIGDEYIDIFKPILLEGQSIGVVQVKASLEDLSKQTIESIKLSTVIFIGLMVVAAFVSGRVMSRIIGPITQLKEIAQRVTDDNDYSLRMKNTSSDEVGVLVESFNKMLDQILERDSALSEEKDKAEISARSAKKYANETENINIDLENEIRERAKIEEELQDLNETLEDKVQARTADLEALNEKIGNIARSAGMAEVASGVLHNVGNVLNSVNVSASVIREQVRKTKSENLSRLVEMMDRNKDNISNFIESDEKGKQIPRFLSLLAEQLKEEKISLFGELDQLASNIDHIKNMISMQQSYAGSYGVREKVKMSDLVEDALKINLQGMSQYGIETIKKYENIPMLYVDKHKALQIIINLISNAKYALIGSGKESKKIYIIIKKQDSKVSVEIKDNGIGIASEDMSHLFEYGFKKRRGGHGYGLHHSALVANELGGKISVSSDGLGEGASFTMIFPIDEQPDI
jgi:two-component system, NtrC family, sensor kinase